jgi:hypothetical protein
MRKSVLYQGKNYQDLLPGFREIILKSSITTNGRLVFGGCVGPCYAMATLLCFGIRDLGLNLFFAVNADLQQLTRLEYDRNLGIMSTNRQAPLKADAVVIMSGLCLLPIEKTRAFIKDGLIEEGIVIGEAPAHRFFEQNGWDKQIHFNFLFEFSMQNPTAFEIDY